MSNSIVAAIYRYVIDDVVRNVQADFEGHGVDTSVLEELQRSWEAKIVQSRVASFPGEDVGYDQQGMRMNHMDSYSYNAPEPTINSAASLASIINNPENMAPSAASLASLAQSGRGQLLEDDEEPLSGKLPEDMRHYAHHYRNIPQNDGAADTAVMSSPDDAMEKWKKLRDERRRIAQLDGASDDDDTHANGTSDSAIAAHGSSDDIKVEAPEDAINSDLDDSDEDEGDEDAEEIEHIVLCQYEKVTRSKNKWKCVLRDGIMLLNGRDYLFQKANGDFEW
ncbi:transcription factor IIA subunit alpha [Coemansia brasiliensis]|uniref:Transcription initiation factor IIA large subunit n=1 Tax=Coemansia brasiliensis TaxID=2650707 RepID=A0A9W8I7N5_9FUNG|nr:transcription factor IIA subunit alpha [Coemansia brasiliensis]